MREIIERYNHKKTGTGHELQAKEERPGEVVVWYLFWGDGDDHRHKGISRISEENGGYCVGWLQDAEQEPFETCEFSSLEELFKALDEEITKR